MVLTEEWRDVLGYEGLYRVSNLGRIISVKRNKLKKPTVSIYGYETVGLYKSGKQKGFFVHRLVAETFIKNPNNYPQINHKDECKTNNSVENLEWCTQKYNNNYGNRNAKISSSKSSGVIQLDSDGNIIKIWKNIMECSLAGYDFSNVSKACRGERGLTYGFNWRYDKCN